MTFLNGVTILLTYQLVGEVGVLLLGIPVPGPVLGMILLFVTLAFGGRKAPSLEPSSTALLSHLSLLFVPAGVGMIVYLDRIADEWLPIGIALVLSTGITIVATAAIMLLTSRLAKRSPKNG